MRYATLLRGLFALLCFSLFSGLESVHAQGAGMPGGPPAPLITPPKVWNQSFAVIRPKGYEAEKLSASIRADSPGKGLIVKWCYDDANGERKFYQQRIDLSYWPTAVARIGDDRLGAGESILVSGKRPANGKTTIQRIDFLLTGVPGPGNAADAVATTLFNADVAGKRGVRGVFAVNGVPSRAFVHFDDSRDLYTIDTTTAAMTLVLTPNDAPQIGLDSFVWLSGGTDTNGAFVYVFQCDFSQHDDGALLLYDYEGDGVVDDHTPLSINEWYVVEDIDWDRQFDG